MGQILPATVERFRRMSSDNGNHVFIGIVSRMRSVQTPSAYVVSVSGTTRSAWQFCRRSRRQVMDRIPVNWYMTTGPSCSRGSGTYGSPTYLKLATSDGSELTFQLDEDDPSITDEYGSSFTLIRDPGTGHSIALYHEPTTYYLNAVGVDYQVRKVIRRAM